MAAALMTTGCAGGNTTEPAAQDAGGANATEEVQVEQKDADQQTQQQTPAGGSEAAYNDPQTLPAYKYQGSEKYLDVISDYLTSVDGLANVYIPFSAIVKVDETDPADILAYGAYNYDGYDLLNTTLFATTGARNVGVFHLKTNDDGSYTVTDAIIPPTTDECEELLAPIPGLFEEIEKVMESDGDRLRNEAVAEYVKANSLNITQWQDYGSAPVPVTGAKETPEEAQFYTYKSSLGYQLTFDLRELSLTTSEEDDMYGKVEDTWTGTLMDFKKAESDDADAAINAALSDTGAKDLKGEDATLAGIACRRAVYDETLEDGRIFRYICYNVNKNGNNITILLETTVEKGESGMSVEELDQFFAPTLETLSM